MTEEQIRQEEDRILEFLHGVNKFHERSPLVSSSEEEEKETVFSCLLRHGILKEVVLDTEALIVLWGKQEIPPELRSFMDGSTQKVYKDRDIALRGIANDKPAKNVPREMGPNKGGKSDLPAAPKNHDGIEASVQNEKEAFAGQVLAQKANHNNNTKSQIEEQSKNADAVEEEREEGVMDADDENSPRAITEASLDPPTAEEMEALAALCRSDSWLTVMQCLQKNPLLGTTKMTTANNHQVTTVLHQAITSKGDIEQRAKVVLQVLSKTPRAAMLSNGYGSLPIHCVTQRSTKITARIKEQFIEALIEAFPGGLVQAGGKGGRTPLHIVFTDYVSLKLTKLMIRRGRAALYMKDKNGCLPIHIACSRHCSCNKLLLLLNAHPLSILETTNDGKTLLALARDTVSDGHPNSKLIKTLKAAQENTSTSTVASSGSIASVVLGRTVCADTTRTRTKRKVLTTCNDAPKRTKHMMPDQAATGMAQEEQSYSIVVDNPAVAVAVALLSKKRY